MTTKEYMEFCKEMDEFIQTVRRKTYPYKYRPIDISRKIYGISLPISDNLLLQFHVYDWRYNPIIVMKMEDNLKAYTIEDIRNNTYKCDIYSRLLKWINKKNIFIDNQYEFMQRFIQSGYNLNME